VHDERLIQIPNNREYMLQTEGLTKSFGSITAVDNVDLLIEEGEVHGLIGPNGAGKTTMLNLVTGQLEPTSGKIVLNGQDITGLRPEEIARRGLGRSFQIVQYFPEMTVRENLRLSVRDKEQTLRSVVESSGKYDDEIQALAAELRLEDRLDTEAANLSHGEKRYLDIGMVLGLDPSVLLFDEPAAGLNQSEIHVLEGVLQRLSEEYTIFLIEHNVELIMDLVDRLTVLHRGIILEQGSPSSVRNSQRVKEVYLGE
jgi:ABC-type branched-subunit amino acid transport system ATPase component